ncbi:transposase [Candidatus Falkowbacteria bacterium]|nr:transposase [Candidatus Falkowbacteria bacterium]
MKLEIYENLKHIVTQFLSFFKIAELKTPANGRPKKIPDRDAFTFALYQHASTRLTKKSVYDDFKEALACSYKTFVVSVNRVAILTLRILLVIMRQNNQTSHRVKYTDATDIPVCLKKNMDEHKTMYGLAGLGRSTKGWFYGLKITLTRDHDGRMLALRFTKPGANDRDVFRAINQDIYGIIVADAGYVSAQLEKDMNIEGKRWILIRPYKTMKKLMTTWQEELYKGRFRIEFDFRDLKLFHGLVTSLPRSISGYLANYLHALLSFVMA